ncbi:MAG TPA: AAA family ATPase [Bacteroidia bacterium]|jgi:predicted ABC-type ATPase|nr:AAA family ATPase [Bacteroidia bacterium]
MPNFYIIAGPNGAGKTTASYTILPEVLHCFEFINADEIARGLSPLKPENAAFEAGRIMLQQIDKHLTSGMDFAIETTLSGNHYTNIIKTAKKKEYKVCLIFLWLKSVEAAKERVKRRVEDGGHNIPEEVIERRYKRGLFNFFYTFSSLVDEWILFDNNTFPPEILAEKRDEIIYYKKETYNFIKNNISHD